MRSRLAQRSLDRHADRWRALGPSASIPSGGWVRALRDALGMTAAQLSSRMGISQAAVTKLEESERRQRIRLDTLRRAADALDCDLVYALVPRRPLGEQIRLRAEHVARRDFGAIPVTMQLEQQGLDAAAEKEAFEDLVAELISAGRLWADP